MKIRTVYILLTLCLLYAGFSCLVYMKPPVVDTMHQESNILASEGRLVWQQNNCQSCHQLYGLGGYLGPDLTNVFSRPGSNESYIKAIIKAGTIQMPAFQLSKEEQESLIAFLKTTDASGSADPRSFVTQSSGMIHQK